MDIEEQQLTLQWGTSDKDGEGEAQTVLIEGRQASKAPKDIRPGARNLMEEAVARANLFSALKRVRANKGAPGIDGMTVEELPGYLKEHWTRIKEELKSGTYRPKPVKSVEIPKPGGGTRRLGIPTVLDRFIQQAILQVLTPIFEPKFSPASFGFRPRRNAHQAVRKAREYAKEGYVYVVDLDIAAFFDQVNHDILMAKLAKHIEDKQILRLTRRYLSAGIMAQGVIMHRMLGTPQGGPLSPLLANVYLTELDEELTARGHRFVRYADDVSVYLKSPKAAERVKTSITAFLAKRLKLLVNQDKSAVDAIWRRSLLGFSFTSDLKVRIDKKALKRAKIQIKKITRRSCGRSLGQVVEQLNSRLAGWGSYFALADTPSIFVKLDKWIRRRLRCLVWKQWKRPRTRRRELAARGVKGRAMYAGYTRKGLWCLSNTPSVKQALPESVFAELGLISLHKRFLELSAKRTAGCV